MQSPHPTPVRSCGTASSCEGATDRLAYAFDVIQRLRYTYRDTPLRLIIIPSVQCTQSLNGLARAQGIGAGGRRAGSPSNGASAAVLARPRACARGPGARPLHASRAGGAARRWLCCRTGACRDARGRPRRCAAARAACRAGQVRRSGPQQGHAPGGAVPVPPRGWLHRRPSAGLADAVAQHM